MSEAAHLESLIREAARAPDGFVEMLEAWNAYCRNFSVRPGTPVAHRLGGAATEASRARREPQGNVSRRSFAAFPYPLFIAGRGSRIDAQNPASVKLFGTRVGQSVADLPFLVEGGAWLSKSMSGLPAGDAAKEPLQLYRAQRTDDDRGLFLFLVAGVTFGFPGTTAIAAVEPRWETVAADLAQTSGLTPAESAILAAFLGGEDVTDIAERRGSALRTVRTQFQALLEKLGAGSQAELVRIGAAQALLNRDLSKAAALARHSDRRAASVLAPGGRVIEVTVAGDPNGQPVMFIPSVTLYRFPAPVEAAFREAGLCVVSVCRPGYGETDTPESDDAFARIAEDIGTVADQLGLERFTLAAHNTSAPFAFHALQRLEGRARRLVVLSGFPPAPHLARGASQSPWTTGLLQSATSSPALLRLMVESGVDAWHRIGTADFIALQLRGSPTDLTAAKDADVIAAFDDAFFASLAFGTTASSTDMFVGTTDWSALVVPDLPPVTYLHGSDDPVSPLEAVEQFARASDGAVEVKAIRDAGHLFPFTHSAALIEELLRTG